MLESRILCFAAILDSCNNQVTGALLFTPLTRCSKESVENEFTKFPQLLSRDMKKGNSEETKRINKSVLWLTSSE